MNYQILSYYGLKRPTLQGLTEDGRLSEEDSTKAFDYLSKLFATVKQGNDEIVHNALEVEVTFFLNTLPIIDRLNILSGVAALAQMEIQIERI